MPGTFYAVKTTAGREELVIDFIMEAVKRKEAVIYSAIIPPGLKGYIFLEADNIYEVQRAIQGIPHARGVLYTPVTLQDIESLVKPEKRVIELNRGDIVEIIAGPFKGSKGKVVRVDKQKEEVTVELLESLIPIPTTVKIDDIRLIQRKEEESETKEEELEEESWEDFLEF